MTEDQFVQWLRGFTEGVHHYSLSPKQWDYLKEKLNRVGNTGSKSQIASYRCPVDYWTQNVS